MAREFCRRRDIVAWPLIRASKFCRFGKSSRDLSELYLLGASISSRSVLLSLKFQAETSPMQIFHFLAVPGQVAFGDVRPMCSIDGLWTETCIRNFRPRANLDNHLDAYNIIYRKHTFCFIARPTDLFLQVAQRVRKGIVGDPARRRLPSS